MDTQNFTLTRIYATDIPTPEHMKEIIAAAIAAIFGRLLYKKKMKAEAEKAETEAVQAVINMWKGMVAELRQELETQKKIYTYRIEQLEKRINQLERKN